MHEQHDPFGEAPLHEILEAETLALAVHMEELPKTTEVEPCIRPHVQANLVTHLQALELVKECDLYKEEDNDSKEDTQSDRDKVRS